MLSNSQPDLDDVHVRLGSHGGNSVDRPRVSIPGTFRYALKALGFYKEKKEK
jgi:hypothetical protein